MCIDQRPIINGIGGEELILKGLAERFPGTVFRIGEDGVGVFVRYTANAPGAPSKDQVRSALKIDHGPNVVFKIPTMLSNEYPRSYPYRSVDLKGQVHSRVWMCDLILGPIVE